MLNGRVFVATSGFSRLSSSFAEPTIFGCFMSVSFILTLIKLNQKWRYNWVLQFFILAIILLTLSKLAMILLIVGFIVMSFDNKKYLKILILIILVFGLSILLLESLGLSAIFERLTEDTGHVDLLKHTLEEFKKINIFTGASIGSIPYGSWHRFVLSRVYESGYIGLIFVVGVCYLPIAFFKRKKITKFHKENKFIMTAAIFCTILGLNLYDYFIHLWPWLIIGSINSYKLASE